jgi:uncharacterized protein (TIGR02599 family)
MPLSCPLEPNSRRRLRSFTLIEVLVTLAVLLLILVALAQAMDSIDRAWKSGAADPFADAQDAFDTVCARLADATLETYEDYADTNGNFPTNSAFVPDHLSRRSDLAFTCGPASGASGLLTASKRTCAGSAVFFTATEGATQTYANDGLGRLLNDMGYFVDFGDDSSEPAYLLNVMHRYRWRLRQVQQPAESLQVYAATNSAAWVQQLVPPGAVIPTMAENVITFVVLPDRYAADTGPALAPAYSYDSRNAANAVTLNQLPPRLIVAMVAIDENSAVRLASQNGSSAPQLISSNLFQQGTPSNQLTQDLATLDAALTAQKIGHRIFQREIQLPSCAWSNTVTP